jgi:hypothetical protein
MKAILSRQPDGRYMMTRNEPILGIPRGLDRAVFYPQFLDPVAYHYMCPEATRIICGGKEHKPGQYVFIDVKIDWLSDPVTPVSRTPKIGQSKTDRSNSRLKNNRLMSCGAGLTRTTRRKRRA